MSSPYMKNCSSRRPAAVERVAPQEHEGTGQHIDAVYLVLVEVTQVITSEAGTTREKAGQSENLAERDPRRGEPPLRLGQETAVAVEHLHTERTGIGVFVEKAAGLGEDRFAHHRIGVEQQHIASCRQLDGLVIGPGKATFSVL